MTSKEDGGPDAKGAPRNFAQVISERAADMPDQIAVYQPNRRVTFARLEDLVSRCTGLLHGKGLTHHSVCALALGR